MNRDERKRQNKTEADRLAQETLDNMKARSEARKEDVSDFLQTWSTSRIFKTALVILPVIFFVVAVLTIVNTNAEAKAQSQTIESIQANIIAKQSEIDALEMAPADVEYIQKTLNSARISGIAVADLQNNYQTLLTTFNSSGNGTPLTENAVAIGLYLENAAEAQGCWYFSDKVEYEWGFETTYDFKAGSSPCLWTCYDKDKNLLAYATGVYNVTTNKFDVEFFVTMAGESYLDTGLVAETDPSVVEEMLPTDVDPSSSSESSESTSESTMESGLTEPTPPLPSSTTTITPTVGPTTKPTTTTPVPTTYNPIDHEEG